MAQVVYLAHNYPVGTELTAFGFTREFFGNAPVAEISSGRHFFESNNNTASYNKLYSGATEIELLVVQNFTWSEIGRTGDRKIMAAVADGTLFSYKMGTSSVETENGFITAGTFDTMNSTPLATDIPTLATAMAVRINYVPATKAIKARVWGASVDGLEAAEPAIWHHEGTTVNTLTPEADVRVLAYSFGSGDFTAISIGTDGDPAAFPSNTQTVSTPSDPVLSNITDTNTDVDWT